MSYNINWITKYLGVGPAPMSYDDFDAIRKQGVDGIVNLCHEYSDLHELEEQAGFEVFYLPTYDEYAPDMDELDKGLQWLDEALYLKKKVLVHCRFGQGRTGTFTSAYLLRRGLDMKGTQKELKKTNTLPTTHRQWKFLKKYKKLQSNLSSHSARIDHNQTDDLSHFYDQYRELTAAVDTALASNGVTQICGNHNDCCCHTSFDLPLLEALYLNDCLNRMLTSSARTAAIERALACRIKFQTSLKCLNLQQPIGLQELYIKDEYLCPLSVDGSCILYETRPLRCRSNGGMGVDPPVLEAVMSELTRLSNETFLVLAGELPHGSGIFSSLMDTVSGKFIQTYFHLMAATKG
jgi:hypothetical protein